MTAPTRRPAGLGASHEIDAGPRRHAALVLAALATSLLAACTGPTAGPPEDPEAPLVVEVEATEAVAAADEDASDGRDDPAVAPQARATSGSGPADEAPEACPEAGAGLERYVHRDEGYCLLFPIGLTVSRAGSGTGLRIVTITRPPTNPYQPESNEASLSVEIATVEPGADLVDLVDERLIDLEPIAEAMSRTEAEIAGLPALVVDGVPGMWTQRRAFLLRGETLVEIRVFPWQDEALAEKQADSERLWQAVAGSLAFFDPEGAAGMDASADPGASDPDPSLTVSEALQAEAADIRVSGYVVEADELPRLCEALAESFPPQCGGSSMPLEGLDVATLPELQSEGAVRWTQDPVLLLGQRVDGVFRVAAVDGG